MSKSECPKSKCPNFIFGNTNFLPGAFIFGNMNFLLGDFTSGTR
jgi:hypothetical protein